MARAVGAVLLGCFLGVNVEAQNASQAQAAAQAAAAQAAVTPPPTQNWLTYAYPVQVVDNYGQSIDYLAKNGKGYQCMNVTKTFRGLRNQSYNNSKTCYQNLVWAKTTGLQKSWAPKCYPDLTKSSSMYQFQWALYSVQDPDNECAGWGCPLPCGMAGQALAKGLPINQVWQATPPPTVPPPVPTMPPTMPPTTAAVHKEGFPWWGIVLCILGALCLLGAAAFYFTHKKSPQKKKRSVKPAPKPAPQHEMRPLVPLPQVRSVSYVPHPAPVATTSHSITTAAPVYSVPHQTPSYVSQLAAPVQAVRPVEYMASSAVYAAPRGQTAMELFDELDVNRDGRVSREEFQRIAELRGIQM